MLDEATFEAIIISPAYRLNVFGFLTSGQLLEEAKAVGEPLDNFGFWDQRLALQGTRSHIPHFVSSPKNITATGYSASGHSVI